MLKENWRFVARLERIGDFIIIVASFLLAYYGRSSLVYWNKVLNWGLPFGGDELAPLKDYAVVLIVALTVFSLSLNFLGAYSSMRLSSKLRLLSVSLISSCIVFFALAATLFLLKIDLSRSFIGLFCLLVGLTLTAERYIVLNFLRYWRRRGRNFRNIIICGIGEQALALASEIISRPELGIVIRAFADLHDSPAQEFPELFKENLKQLGLNRVGKLLPGKVAIERALKDYAIDEIIFTDVVDVMPHIEDMVVICSEQGVRTTIAADLFSIGLVRSGISYFGRMPLIHFHTPPGDSWALAVKRAIDVFIASLLLIILSPLLGLFALLVRVSSPGPIFFIQKRVGLNGRLFDMYKFRSMYIDAEQELLKLQSHNEMQGPVFKMKNDPRITPIGKLLRRFSLDELPQLLNVLIGDMSLVGPRPPIPGEVSLYERRDRRRLSMRPGITCTWQVSGRNEIKDFTAWVKLDLEYIDNWSLGRDLKLLLRTIPAVIFGTGAR